MGAARKYPDELRDRAVRLVLDLVKDQDASVTAACRKVGGELGISEITVKAHRGRMMRKMHAHSLPDLVRMADRLCVNPIRDGTAQR